MSKKILNHPDKEEIIELLGNGESVRNLAAKYKAKYPNNKSLHLSTVTLQKFRKDNLNLEGTVLRDIQEVGRAQQQKVEEKERQHIIETSNAYNKKINEIVDTKLDVARKILELDKIIASRMEYWFNAVASEKETPARGDKELRQFMDRQMALLGQYKKFVEGMADKSIDYNVNITVMNDYAVALRDAIGECLSEFEPTIALKFMDKLSRKIQNLPMVVSQPALNAPVNIEELQEVEYELLQSGDLNVDLAPE